MTAKSKRLVDPELEQYSTPRQWEVLQALASEGTERAAARLLGCNRSSVNSVHIAVRSKAARHGYSPDHDMVHKIPDGYRLTGTSTLYDAKTGDPKIQWVKTQIDRERQEELFLATVEAMTASLPRLPSISGPSTPASSLMACYPVGDHHNGMLSWMGDNVGYNLDVAERLLGGAISHLVRAVPSCGRAVVAVLGDFLHYDGPNPVTPTSGNQLDADRGFQDMVQVAIRSLRRTVELAAQHHEHVLVIVEIGNHDLSTAVFLAECLKNIYENNDRIEVDTTPGHYHYFKFGRCLVGTHHGHGVKMDALPLIMAADRPEEWGETDFRYWWTGHVHHDQVKDFTGCRVESFRVLASPDAWTLRKGHRSFRDMKAIVLHETNGEVSRHIVNPGMLDMDDG